MQEVARFDGYRPSFGYRQAVGGGSIDINWYTLHTPQEGAGGFLAPRNQMAGFGAGKYGAQAGTQI